MKHNEIKIITEQTSPDIYNQEYLLPSELKDSIEGAIAHTIKNGTKVDIRKDVELGLTPKVDFSITPCSASFSAGITIVTKTTKIYHMKD